MTNIFASYTGDSVFRDRYTLTPEYVPDKMPMREKETQRMVEALSILLDPYRAVAANIAIVGEAGVGKTTLAKLVTRDLSEYAKQQRLELEIHYVNCHSFRSKTSILRKITRDKFSMHGRGFSDEELMEMLATRLDKEMKRLVLIVDEVGMLKAEDVLGLIHINELFGSGVGRLSILMITRTGDWQNLLDSHLSGRIQDKIELKKYDKEELTEILNYRRQLGFFQDVMSDEVMAMIIDAASKTGNARHGIEIMLRAGMIANSNRATSITPEFVRAAHSEIYSEVRPDIFRDLRQYEILAAITIGRILSKKGATSTTLNDSYEVFQIVCAEHKVKVPGIATYRNAINSIDRLGVLSSKVKSIGPQIRGRRAVITLLDIPAMILLDRAKDAMKDLKS